MTDQNAPQQPTSADLSPRQPKPDLGDTLAELRHLETGATPGPWETIEGAYGDPSNGPDHMRVLQLPITNASHSIAVLDCDQQGAANAQLIAAIRNALPWLLAEAERLYQWKSQVERLREIVGLSHGWEVNRLRAVVERVWKVHRKTTWCPTDEVHGCETCADVEPVCDGCSEDWPCETIQALGGE